MAVRWFAVAVCVGCLAGLPGTVRADDGDDTLRSYLSKSDVVALGEFTSEPIGESAEAGLVHYQADFKIARLLKGKPLGDRRDGGTIRANVVRVEFEPADKLPALRKGGRCVLFLTCNDRQGPPSYITADPWFGVQPPLPSLAKSLARLAAPPATPKPAGKPGEAVDDQRRLALLKPEMTFDEIRRLWEGKKSLGQTCGLGVNKLTKETGGGYGEVYPWGPADAQKPHTLKVWYFQGKDRPFEVRGPGFHYYRKDGKYVAVEDFPKPAEKPDPAAPADPVRGKYVAYWLTRDPPDPNGAESGPGLLLTRVPLPELAGYGPLFRDAAKRKSEDRPPLLDSIALIFETYQKDSIWNPDGQPLKPIRSVGPVRAAAREVTVNGTKYKYEGCPIPDVVRLLEHPRGKKPLNRIYGPLTGAENTGRALMLLLKAQLAVGPK